MSSEIVSGEIKYLGTCGEVGVFMLTMDKDMYPIREILRLAHENNLRLCSFNKEYSDVLEFAHCNRLSWVDRTALFIRPGDENELRVWVKTKSDEPFVLNVRDDHDFRCLPNETVIFVRSVSAHSPAPIPVDI